VIDHVLVPTDGSEFAERAVRFSAQVADRRHEAEVTVVYVHLRVHPVVQEHATVEVPGEPRHDVPMAPVHDETDSEELVHAQEIVDAAVAEIKSLVTSPDVMVSGRVVVDDRVDDGILKVAEETTADIIVMGTRGLSTLRGAIMGSASHAMIEKAHCPVLIVK
jgi:nucleotide-binding universal stress UspA family protein